MSKPPRMLDVLEAALRDLDVSLEAASQQYGFRLMLLNLRDVRSYEELDRQIHAILKFEINEVARLLPQAYLNYVETFFELGELERKCLSTSKAAESLSHSPPSPIDTKERMKSTGVSRSGYAACVDGIEGLLVEYLSKVQKSFIEIDEDYTWAYEVVKLLIALRYYKYSRNVELLGMGSNKFNQFLGLLSLNPLIETPLRRAVEALSRVDKAGLVKYTIYEAVEAINIAAGLLAHRDELINLLTFYLVTKYYEFNVLRYVFLPKVLRRW